jgi:hypothetical protein
LKPSLGLTASQVHGDAYSGYHKLGITGGVYVNAALSKITSAELGMIFIQKGSRKNQNIEKGDYTAYYFNLNYVEIPLYLRFQPNKFFITVGVSFAYLINYYEANEFGDITGYAPPLKQEYSVNLGVGAEITQRVSFELRTNNSFITIRPYGGAFTAKNVYTNNFIAKQFIKGYYNNILEMVFFYKIGGKQKTEPTSEPIQEE